MGAVDDIDAYLSGAQAPPPPVAPDEPTDEGTGGLGSTFRNLVDPDYEAETAPGAKGEQTRPKVSVPLDVGRKAIATEQPKLEGTDADSVLGAVGNLSSPDASLSDVSKVAGGLGHIFAGLARFGGDMAKTVGLLTTPHTMEEIASHPIVAGEAAVSETWKASAPARTLVGNVLAGDEPISAIPKALLEYAYDNPGEALLNLSLLGKGAGTALGIAGKVAEASKLVEMGSALSAASEALDPITLARKSGVALLKTAAPDTLAGIETTSKLADLKADRATTLQAYHERFEKAVNDEVLTPLNPAERALFRPYVTGRVNLDATPGQQLLTSTGEWQPLKGESVRPEALAQAREGYMNHLNAYRASLGWLPGQVAQEAGEDAMNEARTLWEKGPGKDAGAPFDPMHPMVQEHVQNQVVAAWKKQEEVLKAGDVGEMKHALDLAKEREWNKQVEGLIHDNKAKSLTDAQAMLPRPQETSLDDAMAAMGPQGGVYFPTSGESFARDQASAGRVLTKLGETSMYKYNSRSLQDLGVLENQDPLRAMVQAHMSYAHGQTWVSMAHTAMDELANDASTGVERMPRSWNDALDPRVRAGTHQMFDPAKALVDSLGEERGQRAFARLMETTPGDSQDANVFDVMDRIFKGSNDTAGTHLPKPSVPKYLVPSAVGRAIGELQNASQPVTSPFLRALDKWQGTWRYYTLNSQANRFVNRLVGHSQLALLGGIVPVTPRGISAFVAMGKAGASKLAGVGGEEGASLAKVFDLPGVRSGTGFAESAVAGAEEGYGPLTIGRGVASKVQAAASHLDSFYRGLGMFYEMSPTAGQRAQQMLGRITNAETLAEKVDRLASMDPTAAMKSPEYRDYLRNVDKVFGNYRRQLPIEREAFRRLTPFHKFYTETYKRITRWGFEHPLVANVMRNVSGAMRQDFDDQMRAHGVNPDTDVPADLRDAIPIAAHRDPQTGARSLTLLPRRGGVFDHVSGEPLDMLMKTMDPIHKMVLEQTTGLNLFSRERYRGPISAAADREVDRQGNISQTFHHPSLGEATLRTLWPYQLVKQLAANGRVPNDTSSLLDMISDPKRAYQLDPRSGLPRRRASYSASATLARPARILDPTVDVEEPSKHEKATQRQVVNAQISSLLQRWPERRAEIVNALREAAGGQ